MQVTSASVAGAPARATYALRGHSGAVLTLVEEAGRTYVRKSASQESQNARLHQQCEKLVAAHAAGIPCPAVYRAEYEGGLFFFDMEFIPGEGVSHAITSGRQLNWDRLAPQLVALLSRFKATQADDIPEHAFRDKLASVAVATRGNAAVADCMRDVERLTDRLLNMSWAGIPRSECHGDLTLENILLRQDGLLCFLDFDVPEHSSWHLDLAKMYQDLIGHWCLRNVAIQQPDSTELLNAQVALAGVPRRISAIFDGLLPNHRERMGQLVSFHLMRTLPYAKTADVPAYVVKRIDVILGGR